MLADTYLHQEIHEQPAVIGALLDREQATMKELSRAIHTRDITHVVIAARGTSDNAARYAQYLLGAMNGLSVGLAAPSLFTIYQRPPRLRNALLLGISQSGKSPDIVAVLAEARHQGVLTAALTNQSGSDLAAQADFVINLGAGEERSVAATKTYTAELAAIALLSATLADDADMHNELQQIPAAVSEVLSINEAVVEIVQRYRFMTRSAVIGRGFNYATAYELALKMKELTYTVVEQYSSADFLHGPLALLEPGFPVIVVAPSGILSDEMQTFIRTLTKHSAEVLCISDDEATLALAPLSLVVRPSVPEWLSPLTMIVPGQLFCMHLASLRGSNVDAPRSLHKVTRTT